MKATIHISLQHKTTQMPVLILKRSNTFLNVFRPYEVYLDNQIIAVLKRGEQQQVTVQPGHHVLQARMGKYGSPVLAITGEEYKVQTFTVDTYKNAFLIQVVAMLGMLLCLGILYLLKIEGQWMLLWLLGILCVLVLFTKKSSNYLRMVQEVKKLSQVHTTIEPGEATV